VDDSRSNRLCSTDYVQIEVKVLQKRKAIPLDQNEGIYIRDMKSCKVRAVI
jgi:hypothetical protein